MLATVLLFSAALTPIPMPGYIDRIVEPRADGDVILRTSEHSDFSGGKVRLEQKLRRLSGHRFFIDFSDQPAATKIYHEALCLKEGMIPNTSTGIIGGEDAIAAWNCRDAGSTPGLPATAEEIELLSPDPAQELDRSTDYSFTRAPSGSVFAGHPFFAIGAISVKSSVAGAATYGVSVDNRRCFYDNVEYFTKPFDGTAQIGVNCIGYNQGFLNTQTQACVPRACGASEGTYGIR